MLYHFSKVSAILFNKYFQRKKRKKELKDDYNNKKQKTIEQNLPEFKNPLVGRKYRRSACSCEEPLYKNDPDTRFIDMKMKPDTVVIAV